MVIAFLIAVVVIEIIATIAFFAITQRDSEQAPFVFGWLLGGFTTATCYVLFYQIFPHVCPVVVTGVTGG